MSIPKAPTLITREAATKIIGCGHSTIDRLVKTGSLEPVLIDGRKWYCQHHAQNLADARPSWRRKASRRPVSGRIDKKTIERINRAVIDAIFHEVP